RCFCCDCQTQDLHIDWILFRGRSLIPVSCEVVNDNIDGYHPSSHFHIFTEFILPRTVRMLEFPRWFSKKISHEIQLMDNILPREKRLSSQKFCENATNAPYVYSWCILERKWFQAIMIY
ncbi:hypothetical protein HN51_018048, partial [Arachis hypogaea]